MFFRWPFFALAKRFSPPRPPWPPDFRTLGQAGHQIFAFLACADIRLSLAAMRPCGAHDSQVTGPDVAIMAIYPAGPGGEPEYHRAESKNR